MKIKRFVIVALVMSVATFVIFSIARTFYLEEKCYKKVRTGEFQTLTQCYDLYPFYFIGPWRK